MWGLKVTSQHKEPATVSFFFCCIQTKTLGTMKNFNETAQPDQNNEDCQGKSSDGKYSEPVLTLEHSMESMTLTPKLDENDAWIRLERRLEEARLEKEAMQTKLEAMQTKQEEARLEKEAMQTKLEAMQIKQEEARLEKEAQERKQFEECHIEAVNLLNDPQQPVHYEMLRNGGTDCKYAREPVDVVSWDFHNEVQQGSEGRDEQFKQMGTVTRPQGKSKSSETWQITSEADLQRWAETSHYPTNDVLMSQETFSKNSSFPPGSAHWVKTSNKSSCGLHLSSNPDGVGVLYGENLDGSPMALRVISVTELKPNTLTDGGLDLVENYRKEKSRRASKVPNSRTLSGGARTYKAITQTAAYMIDTCANIAVISTGDLTYALKLRDTGIMQVSGAFDASTTGATSVNQMIVELHSQKEAIEGFKVIPNLLLVSDVKTGEAARSTAQPDRPAARRGAAKGKENHPAQNGTPGLSGAGRSRGLSERRNASPNPTGPAAGAKAPRRSLGPSEPPVRYLYVLQRHPDWVTWKAQLWGTASGTWEDVVIKLYSEAELERYHNEVECYRTLEAMAGVAELLSEEVALPLDGEERPRVGLVVRWAGLVYDLVPPAGLRQARQILEEMHRRGVAQGDVASRNMTYDAETGKVVLFDFSEGLTRAMLGHGAAFLDACTCDLEALALEEAFAAAHPEKCACYLTARGSVALPFQAAKGTPVAIGASDRAWQLP